MHRSENQRKPESGLVNGHRLNRLEDALSALLTRPCPFTRLDPLPPSSTPLGIPLTRESNQAWAYLRRRAPKTTAPNTGSINARLVGSGMTFDVTLPTTTRRNGLQL